MQYDYDGESRQLQAAALNTRFSSCKKEFITCQLTGVIAVGSSADIPAT
jgi:hypothetical protein